MQTIVCDMCRGDVQFETYNFMKALSLTFQNFNGFEKPLFVYMSIVGSVHFCNECMPKIQKIIAEGFQKEYLK